MLQAGEIDSASTGAPTSSADDLLAQLAGDEIDKMLAEADVETAPPVEQSSDPAAITRDPLTETPDKSKSADELIDQIAREERRDEKTADSGPDSDVAPAEPEPAPARKSVIWDSASEPAAAPAESEPSSSAGSRPAPAETSPQEIEAPSAAPERVAEEPAAKENSARPSEEPPEPSESRSRERVPIYVRILEWLNSPLDSLPDATRDAIGKIAVATLVNAVAVIAYVMIFRRK